MEKTHIRKMQNNNYMGEWDLPIENNGCKIFTIKEITSAEVIGNNNQKSIKSLIYFLEHQKPLVLNATNRKSITSAIQSPYIEDWIGKKIELFRYPKLKAFGETMDAIRVKNILPIPPELPLLDSKHKSFDAAVNAVKSKTNTREQIALKYRLSDEFLKAIENENKTI
ncbi:MAG: hypothetical protein ACRC0V_09210 [Fusobacteriaceae bacterium]